METLQDNQEMTIERAIRVLDELLFEFTLRSGGGPDCLLIRESEEALRFLRRQAVKESRQEKSRQETW